MKRLATVITALLVLTGARFVSSPGLEKDLVELTDKTKVAGLMLQGTYLFVHDEDKSARGEPCFSVYEYQGLRMPEPGRDKPIISFHCRPVERRMAKDTIVTVGMSSEPGLFELRELQFANSTVGHLLPGR